MRWTWRAGFAKQSGGTLSARGALDRTVRVTDQRNFARTVLALSSVVVAGCAVAVTIKVMTTDTVPVAPQRVLDQTALERQVAAQVKGLGEEPVDRTDCPLSVPVEVGGEFECDVRVGSVPTRVVVKIVSDQGEIVMEAQR